MIKRKSCSRYCLCWSHMKFNITGYMRAQNLIKKNKNRKTDKQCVRPRNAVQCIRQTVCRRSIYSFKRPTCPSIYSLIALFIIDKSRPSNFVQQPLLKCPQCINMLDHFPLKLPNNKNKEPPKELLIWKHKEKKYYLSNVVCYFFFICALGARPKHTQNLCFTCNELAAMKLRNNFSA